MRQVSLGLAACFADQIIHLLDVDSTNWQIMISSLIHNTLGLICCHLWFSLTCRKLSVDIFQVSHYCL